MNELLLRRKNSPNIMERRDWTSSVNQRSKMKKVTISEKLER
jgi:hypothetical protein